MSSGATHHLIGLIFFILVTASSSTDHIVGANRGWNPGMNYTLWSNNHTFYVNDFISFRYQKMMYNVFEVNQTGYDNCTTEGAVGNWSSGKDFILLDKPIRYYFICGTGGCFSGMKVSVVVHPLPSPPSSGNVTSKHGSGGDKSDAGPTAGLVCFSSVVSVLVVGMAVLWI
ncbi:lamin-like protein [Impatiens glandulifera]|uniref:lamin-like protein n=1 Tax=Impatiens glandulifera TaxID=253017 RepID=UPI001FB07352|nr:lamin-like protein [Impatiens glandulifera]